MDGVDGRKERQQQNINRMDPSPFSFENTHTCTQKTNTPGVLKVNVDGTAKAKLGEIGVL